MPAEVEIKFRVSSAAALKRRLKTAGFRVVTPRTHEFNQLFDFPGERLRRRGELIRLRLYGVRATLTFKAKAASGRHKTRIEMESAVLDAVATAAILVGLGLKPTWAYEKFRTEFSDGKGHVVLDETPIGLFAEIEGPPLWIDQTAKRLTVEPGHYLTATYAELFLKWKRRTRSKAKNMLWKETGGGMPRG